MIIKNTFNKHNHSFAFTASSASWSCCPLD